MKMTEQLETAFINQINLEIESSLLYRQLGIEMELMDLPGISAWFISHAAEERGHADKLIAHLTDRDNHPVLGEIKVPEVKVTSITEAFDIALEAERGVSESIRNLYRLAEEVGDLDSRPLIDWFLTEQIEEEETVSQILGRARLVGQDGSGILRIDDELGGSAGA
ncbi:ferritin [Gordonia sp. VNK21]|uniref:ferritin n=1 Tax=Gordonia sp. VNK21 TaxID=3382483 RepID=UPI0038D37B3C